MSDTRRALSLIRLLADGRLHSGEELAQALGLTRAAVWKLLHRLKGELGLALIAERGRGYRLARPIELLDDSRIRAALSPQTAAQLGGLAIHPVIDSTNAELMRQAAGGAPHGSVCLAEYQTAGRGRRGRRWVSPFGANIYLSVLWRHAGAPATLSGLSLALGVALAETLSELGAQGLTLKWPNDLLWQGRKLAGVLIEISGESQGPCHLVAGIGLNLGMTEDQAQAIDQPWVGLDEVLGPGKVGRNALVARLLDGLFAAFVRYTEEGLAPFIERWRALDAYLGQGVCLLLGDQVIQGHYAGVTDQGALILETDQGLRLFQSGELSLRALAVR